MDSTGGLDRPFGGGGGRIARIASTTSAASCFAREARSFVASEVLATLMSVGRSNFEGCLNVSKNFRRACVNISKITAQKIAHRE
jgi:hypothetical protein